MQQLEATTEITTVLPTRGPDVLAQEIQNLTYTNARLKFELAQEQWLRQQLEKKLNKGQEIPVKELHPRTVIPGDIIPEYFWERLEWEQLAGWSEISLFIFRENQIYPGETQFYEAVEQMGFGSCDFLRPPYEEEDEDEVWNNDVVWDSCLKNLPIFTDDQLLTLAFWGVSKLVDDANQLKELEAFDDESTTQTN